MKRALVLGGAGMLGHKVYGVLSESFDTYVTFRSYNDRHRATRLFRDDRVVSGIDVFDIASVESVIDQVRPDFVINCVGIVKQLPESKNPRLSIYVNSLFPHLLAELLTARKAKLIHVSTDCVFSGDRGGYHDDDPGDAKDLYGRTKYLGEVGYGEHLTLRTSIIGHELFSSRSLIDWFISQDGKSIHGYKNAIFSGLPTVFLSREIARILESYPSLSGVYNVASDPISKFDLLVKVREVYGLDVQIIADSDFSTNKSLNATRYKEETGFVTRSWAELVNDMHEDYISTKYWEIKNAG